MSIPSSHHESSLWSPCHRPCSWSCRCRPLETRVLTPLSVLRLPIDDASREISPRMPKGPCSITTIFEVTCIAVGVGFRLIGHFCCSDRPGDTVHHHHRLLHPRNHLLTNFPCAVSLCRSPRTLVPTALSATLSSISPLLLRLSALSRSSLARRSWSARSLFSSLASPSPLVRRLRVPTVRVLARRAPVAELPDVAVAVAAVVLAVLVAVAVL